MGAIKELAKMLVIPDVQRRGFEDGKAGRCPSYEFCDPFPQDSELAKAYFKGYRLGQETTKPRILNNVNELLYTVNDFIKKKIE